MPPRTVLVTGMSGLIGTALRRHLEGRYELHALYGASKIWGEAVARHYADAYGLSALCVRIGRVKAEDRPGYRDLEHARAVLGFEPHDRAEEHRR